MNYSFLLRSASAAAIIVLSAIFASAQTGSVSGTITESSRNLTLAGASVRLEGTEIQTVTDASGRYLLLGIPAGTIKISASYLGLETLTQDVTVTAGTTVSWDAALAVTSQKYTVSVSAESDLAGQARALNDQKNAINIVNLVASDQIGSFPDPNAAEAVQRIPGIVVQRDQGEGRYVLIRGTEPRLSATTINGERIGTTENTSRQIPLDTIPADLVGAIEVTKELTPDIESDSIGGRVNLITKRAPAARQIAFTVATGVNSLVKDDIKDYSGAFGQRFGKDKKFGFIGSGNYYQTNRGSQDLEPAYTSTLALNSLDLRDYVLTRNRFGGTWDFDYAPSPSSEVYFRGLRSEYTDELRHRFRSLLSNGRLERLLRIRRHDSTQLATMLGGSHILPNTWSIAWRASYSRATLDTPYRLESTFRQTGVTFAPNVTTTSIDPDNIQANPQNQNLSNFNFIQNAVQNDHGYEKNLSGGFDIAAPTRFTNRKSGLFKFGFKVRDANRTRNVDTLTQTPKSGVTIKLTDNGQADYSPADNYLGGKYIEFGNLFPDPTKMRYNSLERSLLNTVVNPTGDSGSYRAKERVTAGYLMEELYLGEKTTLLGGIRFEQTNTKYSAPQYRLTTGGAVASRTIFDGEHNYLNINPGIHFRHQLFADTPLRISFSRTLARPNYSDLAPFVLQDTTGLTISKGNPALNVTTSNNFDASLEHYFQNVGVVSGGFFYKHLNNYIYTTITRENVGTDLYTITQPINGSKASLYGIELNLVRQLDFLPGYLKGIDIYANYTHVHSHAILPRGDFRLPSQASEMGNLAIGYTLKGFSSRLSLNNQGRLPLAIGATVNDDNWLDHRLEVDFSASQRLGRHVKLFVDTLNLANRPYRVYLGTTPDRPLQEERYKMWAILGVKLTF